MALTPKKKKILDYIRKYQEENGGVSPSLREIAAHMGIRTVSTVHVHLKDLKTMGLLEHRWNEKRGLRLRKGKESRDSLELLGYIAAGKPIESVPDPARFNISEMLLAGGQNYLLRVTGDSMIEEGIYDGDFIVARRAEDATDGEMVVALVGGEVTLKRIYREGKIVRLQPAHPSMEPLRFPAKDVQIQGIVVGLLRKYGG